MYWRKNPHKGGQSDESLSLLSRLLHASAALHVCLALRIECIVHDREYSVLIPPVPATWSRRAAESALR